jgi:type I restriction enzyme, S subunit
MREGWKHVELGEHIDLLTGNPFKSAEYSENGEGVRLLRGDNVVQGAIRWDDARHWPNDKISGLERYHLAEDDVVVALDRTWVKAGLKAAKIKRSDLPCMLVQRVARIRAVSTLDQKFLAAIIQSHRFVEMVKSSKTETAVPHISPNDIREFVINRPPLPEQRKIAEILGAWDEALEKLIALREAKARRLEGIAQRLLAPSRAIGRGVPRSNWTPSSFGEVFEERQDKNAGLGADDVVTVGKYAIRKQSEHFTRSVASKDLSNYWTISPGDFVYDPMSVYYGAIGRYSGSADGIVSPAYRAIKLSPEVDPEFMVALIRTHHIRFLLETRSSQGNKEGKRRLLQRDEFESIEFKLPPVETQRKIAAKLAVFRSDFDLTAREFESLTRQKRGLMQKLLTGEWRVSSKKELA